jgi:hypothetical protein
MDTKLNMILYDHEESIGQLDQPGIDYDSEADDVTCGQAGGDQPFFQLIPQRRT